MNILLTTLNAKYIHKNLALRYLYTTKPEGFHCIIKEYTIKEDTTAIANDISAMDIDVVGFSCYIWNIEQTSDIIRILKQQRPELIVVLGGPEVSFDAPHFLRTLHVDAVVCGEGEFVFWDYLKQLKQSNARNGSRTASPLSTSPITMKLPNPYQSITTSTLVIEIDGVFTQKHVPANAYAIADLAALETYPSPYFLDFDRDQEHNRYFYMETSRGCPYRCAYCLSSVQGRVRMFSQNHVINVLNQVFQSRVKQIKFLDRTFNVDKQRALEFASHIQTNAKPEQIFQFEIMAEYVSDELIEYLQKKPEKPQFRFEIGIQSTNQHSLREIDRVQNFERLRHVIQQLQKSTHPILHVDLIAGLPFEDLTSFRQSFNDVFSLQTSELQLGFLKLLRGTSLRRKANQYGMIYDDKAPYEVTQTAWVRKQDLEHIHAVEYALDALYNMPRMRTTIDTILAMEANTYSPFDLLYQLGKPLLVKKYKQLDELFARVSAELNTLYADQCHAITGLLANDYYALFKQRPKRFHVFAIDDVLKNSIYQLLQQDHTINDLIHYGMFDAGYDTDTQQAGYQFILYNKDQTYPIRYFINQEATSACRL